MGDADYMPEPLSARRGGTRRAGSRRRSRCSAAPVWACLWRVARAMRSA